MSQTSYSRKFVNAFAGMLGDSGPRYIQTRINGSGSDLPAGIGVKDTTTEQNSDVPSAATDALSGIIVNTFARDPGTGSTALSGTAAIKSGNEMNVLSEGTIFVKPEQTVAIGDLPFVRFATSANTPSLTQKGSFRKDADGAAQVSTGTPTATNSLVYVVRVAFDGKAQGSRPATYEFEYQADASATAAEIVTGLKAVMAADSAFTARVVATGTTTLILTAQTAGEAFTVNSEGDGGISWAATTPPAATARAVKGARFLKPSDSTTGVALMYFSAALDAALA